MWLESRVVVVIPAWEEAPRISRVLRGIPCWVDRVIVVDDASVDATSAVASSSSDPRIELLRHERNRGVGAAIATGYRRALAASGGPQDAFVVMAGDGQMDPADLPRLVDPIARGEADYVKGNRFLAHDVKRVMPVARRWAGVAFSWATSWAIGTRVSDSQCGYTALSRGACERLDLDGLWAGYGYPNDLLSQLAIRRFRIAEAPVRPVYADEVSRLKLRHVPVVAALIARAWLRRLRRSTIDGSQAGPRARSRIAGT